MEPDLPPIQGPIRPPTLRDVASGFRINAEGNLVERGTTGVSGGDITTAITETPAEALTITRPSAPSGPNTIQDIQREIDNISTQLGGIQSQAANLFQPTTPSPVTTQPETFTTPSGAVVNRQGDLISGPPGGTTVTTPAGQTGVDSTSTTRRGLVDRALGLIGLGGQETATEQVDRILPVAPPRLAEIDQELANLQNQAEQAREVAENRLAPTFAIVGEQAAIDRQFAIRQNALLRERDAVVGDFDRATERAKLILQLETEQNAQQRENQLLAIDLLLGEAEFEESLILNQFKADLERQASTEQTLLERAFTEQDQINAIIQGNPEAFAGRDLPRTLAEAQTRANAFAAPILSQQRELDIAEQQAQTRAAQALAAQRFADILPAEGGTTEQGSLRQKILSLSAGQQDAAFAAVGVQKDALRLVQLLRNPELQTGKISGTLGRAGQIVSGENEIFNEFKAGTVGFTAAYIKALSGVQVSDKERQFLLGLLPTEFKQEEVNIAGIKTAVQRLRNKYETQLGIDYDDFPNELPSLDLVRVKVKSTGETGTVLEAEFDPDIYEVIE